MLTLQFNDLYPIRAITPAALSSYVKSEGWRKIRAYREYSDIYAAEGKPEIIVPRTDIIDDYEAAIESIIGIFAKVLERDEVLVYHDLALADRDALRFKAMHNRSNGGALPLESAHVMLNNARAMLIAAANSLYDAAPDHKSTSYPAVADYLERISVSNAAPHGLTLTLLSPPLPPRLHSAMSDDEDEDVLMERRAAERLGQALFATRRASERVVSGDPDAFNRAVASGVSANLCAAVAAMLERVAAFDVSFSWALTRPTNTERGPVSFAPGDIPILREAARSLRNLEPERGHRLYGFVHQPAHLETDIAGTVRLKPALTGKNAPS